MNVFVLNTGRCGSTTFAAACQNMTNYTAAHESWGRNLSEHERYRSLRYPSNHIEVDNRLSWFLGTLDKQYGTQAFYVHLLRDREEVARSFVTRWDNRMTNIIFSFAWGILSHRFDEVVNMPEHGRLRISRQYWDVVNENIRLFLRDKPHQLTLWLHDIKQPFQELWHRIRAEGDLSAALDVWDTPHNASLNPHAKVTDSKQEWVHSAELQATDIKETTVLSPVSAAPSEHDASGNSKKMRFDINDKLPNKVSVAEEAIIKAMHAYASVSLDDIQPPLEPNSWTLTEDTLRFLVSLIEHLEPRHIVEFGSGLSTQVLARASSRSRKPIRITTVDHDPEFIERTRQCLAEQDPKGAVSLICAPLVARRIAGKFVPVYHFAPDTVSQWGPAELVLIDGPPYDLGGREGVLYQVMDIAQSGTVVLLDDANRREERKAVLNWRSSFGPAIRTSSLAGFPRGLSVITIADPIRSAEVPQHGMGGAVRELQRRIEPGTTWIVVDDGQLDWNTFAGRSVLPFLERNGQYWGPPGSGVQAVDELERLRNCGADFIAFVACSFWWLEHYPELRQHLESSFDCRLHDEQLVIYDMRGNRG